MKDEKSNNQEEGSGNSSQNHFENLEKEKMIILKQLENLKPEILDLLSQTYKTSDKEVIALLLAQEKLAYKKNR